MAAARAQAAGTAVMLLTQNAAANIAAYGQPFLNHDGARLLYGLHGHLPYDGLSGIAADYRRYRFHPALQRAFETWFLPLYSWHAKSSIAAGQLPNLLKHFHRASLATPGVAGNAIVHGLHKCDQSGRNRLAHQAGWVGRRPGNDRHRKGGRRPQFASPVGARPGVST
ncbi:hypothetical protein AB0K74_49385 [Streptomyces sp. NPDC056159]|uniref:hypothetical protein n=1 Tax=Streptomyces sp. NPDC056159 TaxID=3155537 RepID=UPI003428B131